jgi:hypothetical protein
MGQAAVDLPDPLNVPPPRACRARTICWRNSPATRSTACWPRPTGTRGGDPRTGPARLARTAAHHRRAAAPRDPLPLTRSTLSSGAPQARAPLAAPQAVPRMRAAAPRPAVRRVTSPRSAGEDELDALLNE